MLNAQKTSSRSRGFSLPLLAVMFIVLIGFVAFAVDVGRVSVTRAQLQSMVDAATLAGSSGLPISSAEVRARARNIAAGNTVDGKPLTLLDSDIELGMWDRSLRTFVKLPPEDEAEATAVRVTCSMTKARGNPLPLTFARILGFESTDLVATSTGGFAQAADVVLVQDITTSFAEELADAKTGDLALLQELYANGKGRSSMGVVVHTGWGRTLSLLQPIATNYNTLYNVINGIGIAGSTGMPVASGTDIAAGLEEAIAVFNDGSYHRNPNAVKAIVLVSDGSPSRNAAGKHPSMSNSQLLTEAQRIADLAWAEKIHVYVVFFNRDNDATAAANLRSLKRGTGDFVQVTDATLLPDALAKLTRRLPMALLK